MSSINEKYKIIQKLGNQTKRKFGSVFLVEDKQTRQLGILKGLSKNESNLHLQLRLRKEAEISFEFNGLPKTLDFIETESEIIVIKSYIKGISLDEFWKNLKRRDRENSLLNILKGLIPIFNHLKEQKIVHCDIKPSNILVDLTNGDYQVGLIDFGMSIKTDEKNSRKTLFPLGFAAPELLLNHLEVIDQRTDFFALGITIWKLYSGHLPLTHPNPSIFTNLQLTYPLPDHSSLPKGWYPFLKKMCHKHQFRTAPNLLNKDDVQTELMKAISLRYVNLEDFVNDLQSIRKTKRWFNF